MVSSFARKCYGEESSEGQVGSRGWVLLLHMRCRKAFLIRWHLSSNQKPRNFFYPWCMIMGYCKFEKTWKLSRDKNETGPVEVCESLGFTLALPCPILRVPRFSQMSLPHFYDSKHSNILMTFQMYWIYLLISLLSMGIMPLNNKFKKLWQWNV